MDEIDLHVVAMLVLFTPALFLSAWWAIPAAILPQGRILVRAFWDYPAFGQRPWKYLLANELLVLGVAAVVVGVKLAIE